MWRKTSRKKKVLCLIAPKPSIMPTAHNLKLDARCDEKVVVQCQGTWGRAGLSHLYGYRA